MILYYVLETTSNFDVAKAGSTTSFNVPYGEKQNILT